MLKADAVDFPLFNQDLEHNPTVLNNIERIYQRFLSADGLVVVTPEYNGSVSPYLKNTVDWVSRLPRILGGDYPNPFYHKPILLACATAGSSNGQLGMQSARNVFAYLGGWVVPEQISVPFAQEAWADDGGLIDVYLSEYIQETLKIFGSVVNKYST
jgi:NAD(P)H-dependent FMN reductase